MPPKEPNYFSDTPGNPTLIMHPGQEDTNVGIPSPPPPPPPPPGPGPTPDPTIDPGPYNPIPPINPIQKNGPGGGLAGQRGYSNPCTPDLALRRLTILPDATGDPSTDIGYRLSPQLTSVSGGSDVYIEDTLGHYPALMKEWKEIKMGQALYDSVNGMSGPDVKAMLVSMAASYIKMGMTPEAVAQQVAHDLLGGGLIPA